MQPPVINIFEKAAKKAGRILTRDFGEIENLQIQSKNLGDFVSNADLKVSLFFRLNCITLLFLIP